MSELDPDFKNEVMNEPGGEQLKMCFSCTGCSVSCPVSEIEPKFNPRRYIHQTLVGLRDEVLGSEYLWRCVQCHSCYESCPQDVRVTELISAMRSLAEKEISAGRVKIKNPLPQFEHAFTESVQKNGRVHESMVIAMHVLKHQGVSGMLRFMPLGIKMMRRGKFLLFTKSIERREDITKLFNAVKSAREAGK
ncbi:MAG: 4Fe-4S dicluster domain-containing protein [Methermicoccaceae archaeon]